MQHYIGCLYNADTGYVIDAGVILYHEEEQAAMVVHTVGGEEEVRAINEYRHAEFPRMAVLDVQFNPN